MCWREMRKNSGPLSASLPSVSRQDKGVEPDLEGGQAIHSNPPVEAPSSTTPLSTPKAAVSTTAEAGAASAQTGSGESPVPRWLRWPILLLWNIACIGSLIIALVWFTEDVSGHRLFLPVSYRFPQSGTRRSEYRTKVGTEREGRRSSSTIYLHIYVVYLATTFSGGAV